MHIETWVCFLTCHSAWRFPTTEIFVCVFSTHLSAIWSHVWQCAESGCLLGYDRWLHRSLESLLRWPSTACHLERDHRDGKSNKKERRRWRWRGGEWRESIIKDKKKKGEESEVQSKEKHIKPLRDSCSLWLSTQTCFRWLRCGKWMNHTNRRDSLMDNKQAVHTLKHVAHL